MKKAFLFFLVFIISSVYAQDDFQKWLQKDNANFEKYLSEQDKKFSDFLKKDWKAFSFKEGLIKDKTPEPQNIPVYKPENQVPKPQVEPKNEPPKNVVPKNEPPKNEAPKKEPPKVEVPKKEPPKENPPIPVVNPVVSPVVKPVPPENKPVDTAPKPITSRPDYNFTTCNFYNGVYELAYPKAISFDMPADITNQVVADYWRKVSSVPLNDFFESLAAQRKNMKLNDWAFIKYVCRISGTINNGKENESTLFAWYILIKSGYNIKLGLMNKKLIFLVKSNELIYETPFITLGNNDKIYAFNFYSPENLEGNIFTYDGDYPGAEKNISLLITQSPVLQNDNLEKTYNFEYGSVKYSLRALLNKNLIEFYKDYPVTPFETYFNADVSEGSKTDILNVLRETVKGKKEIDAINIILHFVQTAFDYKTDQEIFGREKPLFVEETLYYPYSNCKDRAILFAFLIKKVLGLKVVGVQYPGHLATAVAMKDPFTGDFITEKGQKYYICDPTYINAPAGLSMPGHGVSNITQVIQLSEN